MASRLHSTHLGPFGLNGMKSPLIFKHPATAAMSCSAQHGSADRSFHLMLLFRKDQRDKLTNVGGYVSNEETCNPLKQTQRFQNTP